MNAADWDDRYRSTDRLWSASPNLFVADRLADARPGRGLDVAAGEGRNARWLSSLGWTMTAVDFSEVAVARGSEGGDDVEFVIADVLEWEPNDQFDLVLIAYLQLSAPELEKVIRRSRAWLDPGGEMFLIGHDASNLEHGWGGPPRPEILWEVPVLLGWLDGMDVVESAVVNRPVETEDGMRYARDSLIRVRAV